MGYGVGTCAILFKTKKSYTIHHELGHSPWHNFGLKYTHAIKQEVCSNLKMATIKFRFIAIMKKRT